MANMSYCRFRNTVNDLADCQEAINDGVLQDDELDEDERRAARRLIRICKEIAESCGTDEDDD